MEKTKKYLTAIAIIVLTFFSFVVGWMFGFNEHVSLVKEAKAEPINLEMPKDNMTSGRSCQYEMVYCYGHNFLIFYSNSGDIEVVVIN